MSDEAPEMPEWPTAEATPDDKKLGITERIDQFLQVALNENDSDLGPQVVVKWIVIADVQLVNVNGRSLRVIESDLTNWEITGMLDYAKDWYMDSGSVFDVPEDGDDVDPSNA